MMAEACCRPQLVSTVRRRLGTALRALAVAWRDWEELQMIQRWCGAIQKLTCTLWEGFRIFGWLSSFFPFFYYVALWVLMALFGGLWGLGEGDEEGAVVGVGRVRKVSWSVCEGGSGCLKRLR